MFALLAIVLPLGLDTFALALVLGASGLAPRERLRVSLILAGFEAGMPLVGLALGSAAGRVIGGYAELLAGLVLIIVGLSMLREEDEKEAERAGKLTSTHGLKILTLGVSIALDELAVGFTFGLIHINTSLAIILIAAQAVLVAQIGLRLGTRLGEAWGERAEKLAGAALTTYGAYLVITHTWHP